MQILTVDCNSNKTKIITLVVGWLKELGAHGVTHENALQSLSGMALIIPHESWAYCNLSGSSVPPFVKLDYSNKVCAVQKLEVAEDYLKSYHTDHAKQENHFTHYCSEGALCGEPKNLGWHELTEKISDVTCPHCLLEIIVRIPINPLISH